jgi:signal transduction histidine kinase
VAAVKPLTRLTASRPVVDLLLWLVLMVPVLFADDLAPTATLSMPAYRLGSAMLLALAVPLSRRTPLLATAAPAAFSIIVTGGPYSALLMPAQLVLAFLLGRRADSRQATVRLLSVLGLLALVNVVAERGGSADGWFLLTSNSLATIVLPWAVGQYVRQLAELRDAGWGLAQRLEHEQDRAASQVRLRERARIAADMHDSLGHELSLIAVRAAALEVTPGIGVGGRRAAGELRSAAESATDRLREIIGMLREEGDEPPVATAGDGAGTRSTLRTLVERAVGSGMAVSLTDSTGGADPPIPEATAQAVYRVVQEALTNVAKHAPGATVTVTLQVGADRLVVEVVNTAPPAPQPRPVDRGYGLVGLDERVRLVGGNLEAGPTEAGFAVRARLPLGTPASVTPAATVPASSQALAMANRRLRRGLVGILWPPVAMAAVLLLLYLRDVVGL